MNKSLINQPDLGYDRLTNYFNGSFIGDY